MLTRKQLERLKAKGLEVVFRKRGPKGHMATFECWDSGEGRIRLYPHRRCTHYCMQHILLHEFIHARDFYKGWPLKFEGECTDEQMQEQEGRVDREALLTMVKRPGVFDDIHELFGVRVSKD